MTDHQTSNGRVCPAHGAYPGGCCHMCGWSPEDEMPSIPTPYIGRIDAELSHWRGPGREWTADDPKVLMLLNLLNGVLLHSRRASNEPRAPLTDEHNWWCETCKIVVAPDMVTHDETHDLRYGGCGQHVFCRAAQPPGALRPGLERAEEIISAIETPADQYEPYKNRLLDALRDAIYSSETKEVKP